ncbi:MAG: chromate efflux transporter [Acidobacteriia bacterium]|nr:chromate efflux transporter [Terriglobia bacterium]
MPEAQERSTQVSASLGVRLRELAALFLKLGTISFGGPAAHIALMETEVVRKRQWLTRQQFLDMLGAANLVPGPTSTEMAISTGFVRAGWVGLCVAGASFILPAALITGAFAWTYVRFGALPQAGSVLAGIKPAVIAVIAIATSRLGRSAVRNVILAALGVVALAAFFLKLSPIAILFGGGVAGMVIGRAAERRKASPAAKASSGLLATKASLLSLKKVLILFAVPAAVVPVAKVPLVRIALFFLKVGAVLYGGGYVLLAFLEQGLIHQHAWLTQQQLLDAVAIGQFTPGPVLSSATFIGYILGGVPGAAVATAAIFLPSFFYVALLAPVLFKLRQSPWLAAILDSVNVCAVALMGGVTVRLAADALRGWPAWVIAVAALACLWRWKLNPAWVVLGGGLAGLALAAVR